MAPVRTPIDRLMDTLPARIRDQYELSDLARRAAVLVLGATACGLLVAAEFSTISSTQIGAAGCEHLAGQALADGCDATGGERHGYMLAVLGLVAAAMAWGVARRGRRPAAAALVAIGVIAAIVALAIDAPTLGDTGTLGQLFTSVETQVGTGFWLEVAGAVCALAAGGLGLMRTRQPAPAAAPSVESVVIADDAPRPDVLATHAS